MKIEKPKKLKKKKISQLTKTVKSFHDYVKAKHQVNGYCQCSSCDAIIEYGTKNCQAGHFISCRIWEFRFDEDNVFPQCYKCNIIFKGCFEGYSPFVIKTVGKKKHDYMIKVANDITRGKAIQKRFSDIQLKEIQEKYEKKIKEL